MRLASIQAPRRRHAAPPSSSARRCAAAEIERAVVDRAAADHAVDAFALDAAQALDVGDAGQPARGDDGNRQRLRELDGGVDVDAGEHAVAADVGVDHALDAVILELLRQVDDFVAGQLAPAVGGHLAVLGVEADDDVAAEGRAGVAQEARLLDRGGADDDVAQAVVEVALDGVQIAQAAAELHRDAIADRPDDGLHRRLVDRLAGEGAVQVDQVQAPGAGREPALGHCRRVFAEGGGDLHVTLLEAHAVTVLEVDRGYQQHGRQGRERSWLRNQGFQRRKLRYSVRPSSALFSGWNWVAKMLSRATAEVKRTP